MKSPLHYLTLFFIISIGVTTGNLLSNTITGIYVDMKLRQATSELNKSLNISTAVLKRNLEANNIKRKREKEIKNIQSMEARDRSTLGRQLMRECEDWIVAKKKTPGYTTELESKKKCERYDTYIRTGRLLKQ